MVCGVRGVEHPMNVYGERVWTETTNQTTGSDAVIQENERVHDNN